MSSIEVWFDDKRRQLGPGDTLTIGRHADLSIPGNPHLHRRLLLIQNVDGVWWVSNTGANIIVRIYDDRSPSSIKLAPDSSVPLGFPAGTMRFDAGSSSYEVGFRLPAAPEVARGLLNGVLSETGQVTAGVEDLHLNIEQRMMVVALAENRLRNPDAVLADIPANRNVAMSLGWTLTKFNRKLDNLCLRLDRRGIKGMRGDVASLASNRRELLVEYLINQGVIDSGDLDGLDDYRQGKAD